MAADWQQPAAGRTGTPTQGPGRTGMGDPVPAPPLTSGSSGFSTLSRSVSRAVYRMDTS